MATDNSSQQPEQPAAGAAPFKPAWIPLPEVWPGAFAAYKLSKQAVMYNVNTVVGWVIIAGVVGILLESILKTSGEIINGIVNSLTTAILTSLYIAGVRQQKVDFKQAWERGLKLWLKMFLLFIIIGLTVIASIIALVIPVFFIAPRLTLAPYFLVDKDMDFMDAYRASWHATKGNVGKLYGIFGVTFLMALLLLTIIGIPFSIYFLIMYSAVTAVLYEYVLKHQPAQVANDAAPAAAAS